MPTPTTWMTDDIPLLTFWMINEPPLVLVKTKLVRLKALKHLKESVELN